MQLSGSKKISTGSYYYHNLFYIFRQIRYIKGMGLSKFLIISLLGFILGIFLGSYLGYNLLYIVLSIGALLVIAYVFRKEELILLFACGAVFLILGIFYFNAFNRNFVKNTIKKYNGQKVTLEGYISRPPDVRQDKVVLTLMVEKIASKTFKKATGQVLLYGEKYPNFNYGDYIKTTGVLNDPPVFPDFNYRNYLARYQIFSVMFPEQTEFIKKEPHFNFWQQRWFMVKKELYFVKGRFEEMIGRILPEPEAALLDGLLLGVKKYLPQNVLDNFSTTGTTHILVISGFNITIIIKAFMSLTRRWSRGLSYFLALSAIFAFVVMTGAEAPIVRAAIMAIILMWAEREGRMSDATIALLLAATIMIFINPLVLRFDVGFQLSFLATAGLIYISPLLKNWVNATKLKKLPELILEPGIASIAAQIFVLPIILDNFGRLSLISPIANILILPLIPLTMLIGFLSVVLGFLWVGLGQIVGMVSWILLAYIIFVVQKLSQIPGASFEIKNFDWIWLSVYYAGLVFVIFFFSYYKKIKTTKNKNLQAEKATT